MPLVRLEVRNEYGLGDPELYRAATKKKGDPKELLDGVAVAGLVGILRQLGDLAEFASDIFHELHEQVTATSVRGRKLLTRIQHLETALPSFENAVQGQRSHIHFSYVPGSDWHGDLQVEQSHLFSSDLPRFMMDSYEECRDPPRLYLLDKFDSTGPGSCLKRYSDPSYFKRVRASSELERAEKVQREKKAQKIKFKMKGSQIRNGEVERGITISGRNSSVRFASPSSNEQHFSTETIPISDMKLKPELASRSTSFDSRTRLYYDEQVPDTNSSGVPDELEHDRLSLSKFQINQTGSFASDIHDKLIGVCTDDDSPHGSLNAESSHKSPSVTWDEKTEIQKPTSPRSCDAILVDGTKYVEPVYSGQSNIETETAILETVNGGNSIFHTANVQAPLSTVNHFEEVTSETENYMDALNTLELETETDSECQTKREVKSFSNFSCPQMVSGTSQTQEMTSPMVTQEMASSSSDVSSADTVSGSHSSSNEDQSPNTYNLVPSESFKPVLPPHSISCIPDPNGSIGNEIFEHNAVDMSRMQYFEGVRYDQPLESSFCGSLTALVPRTTADVSSPDSPPGSISSIPKPKFWTNGGLLGLEPSKPPDFGASKVSSEDLVSDSIVSRYDHSSNSQVTKLHQETVSSSDEIMSRSAIFVKKMDGSPNSSLNQSSLSGDQRFGRRDNVVPSSDSYQHSESYLDNQLDNMPSNQNSQIHLRALSLSELEKIHDSLLTNINAQNGCHLIAPRGSELPSSNSVESQPNESSQNTVDIASSISAFAQRILANSLQRKPSITQAQYGDVNTDINKSQDTSLLNNQKEGQTRVVSEANYAENMDTIHSLSLKNLTSSNSYLSGRSSPPLEHMKISFHPMNGLETSKLKLEYASSNFHESIEDLTFPSFQLLPRSSDPLEHYGSETDDDTFCRSCPCTSEEHLSPRSDSNSELLGQDDISGGKNHEMYENLSRISLSSSSVSSFKGFDTASGFVNLEADNSILYFQNGNYIGLPGLDSFTSTHDKGKCDSLSTDPEDSASISQNRLPPPPPLPPMQWRMTKSSFDKHEEKDSSVAEIVEQFNVLQTQVTTGHKQQEPHIPKPPPFAKTMACPTKKSHGQLNGHKEPRNNDVNSKQLDGREELFHQIRNKQNQQKLNGHKEPKLPCANGQEVDEREELLHQIRNQTFNLRCTSTAKPPLELQPTTNINVAAILEKANAIRQAFVGSGDDDNWSDG